MIQRIQSIWLLLASACSFLSLKMPFYSGTTKEGVSSHELLGVDHFYLMMLTIAIGVIAFISIFLYSNRKLQMRLCILDILLEGLLIFLFYKEVSTYKQGTLSLTALLHALILIFLIFAVRGINRDAKIIRDSNRLR
jgi:Ca2+/Na+ antiporter